MEGGVSVARVDGGPGSDPCHDRRLDDDIGNAVAVEVTDRKQGAGEPGRDLAEGAVAVAEIDCVVPDEVGILSWFKSADRTCPAGADED